MRNYPTAAVLNINDVDQVNAFFDAIAKKATPEELSNILRQIRSPEEIRADNVEAQFDYEREAEQQGVSISELLK